MLSNRNRKPGWKKSCRGIVAALIAAVLIGGSAAPAALPFSAQNQAASPFVVQARAAESKQSDQKTDSKKKDEKKKDAAAEKPKGPQNELEIRAKKEKVSWPKGPDVLISDKAVLMDLDTGEVLYAKNAEKKDFPASTTKVMTAMLVLENSTPDEVVTFSKDAVTKTEGSGIWRVEGEKLTVEQCMYAMMLASANECAYALAEHVTDGDYKAFIQMMNDRAAALGCENTHFVNPNGLPDEKHVTTAHDLAKIASAAYQNEAFRKYAGAVEYTIPKTNKQEEPVLMYQHHKMICDKKTDKYIYKPATAGKTGYTKAASNTLVTFAEKDGRRLVCVILRSTQDAAYTETKALFEYGFSKFENVSVAENETRFDTEELTEGYIVPEGKELTGADIDPGSMITLPKDVAFEDTTADIVFTSDAEEGEAEDGESEDGSEAAEEEPVKPIGNQMGEIIYTYGGNEIGRASILVSTKDLISEEEEESDDSSAVSEMTDSSNVSKMFHALGKAQKFLSRFNPKVLLIGAIIILVIIIVIIASIVRAVRRHADRRELARTEQEGYGWDDIHTSKRGNYDRNSVSSPGQEGRDSRPKKEAKPEPGLPDGNPSVMEDVEDLDDL